MKQKVYYEKCSGGRGYSPISKYLKIRMTMKGNSYILFRGRRIKFEDVERLTYPIMPLDDEDGREFVIGGYYPLSMRCVFLIEIDPDGEYARVWEEIEK